jgi:periplasmic protein CpxP/Spy
MYKYNFKVILSVLAISALAVGCQPSSPNGTAQSNPAGDTTNATSVSSQSTPSAASGDRYAELNLTDVQKTQIKDIRAQSKAKVIAILTPEQQTQFKTGTADAPGSSMKALRSLNLSDTQKQQIKDILQGQRQTIQGILTPEQQAKLKESYKSKDPSASKQ